MRRHCVTRARRSRQSRGAVCWHNLTGGKKRPTASRWPFFFARVTLGRFGRTAGFKVKAKCAGGEVKAFARANDARLAGRLRCAGFSVAPLALVVKGRCARESAGWQSPGASPAGWHFLAAGFRPATSRHQFQPARGVFPRAPPSGAVTKRLCPSHFAGDGDANHV